MKVLDLETREVIANFTGESSLECSAVAADGVQIIVGEVSGRRHFLTLEGCLPHSKLQYVAQKVTQSIPG